jgi:hypothetical protein
MRQRREVVGDGNDPGGHDDRNHGHRHGQVPLLADGHQQLHAKLHAGERGKRRFLRLCDRQALAQRVDSRLRPYRAHGKGGSAGRKSDQTGDGRLRRNKLISLI